LAEIACGAFSRTGARRSFLRPAKSGVFAGSVPLRGALSAELGRGDPFYGRQKSGVFAGSVPLRGALSAELDAAILFAAAKKAGFLPARYR
jgi:hypothetical protein